MADREHADRADGLALVNEALQVGHCGGFQYLAAVARCVTRMQDGIGDGGEVELANIGGQRQLPLAASDSCCLERKIPLVVQVGFEKAAVVLARAGDDRLHGTK